MKNLELIDDETLTANLKDFMGDEAKQRKNPLYFAALSVEHALRAQRVSYETFGSSA